MTQLSPVRARLVAEVGWDRAFAVINLDCDDDFEIPPMRVATCGTIPVRGEHCAWMEIPPAANPTIRTASCGLRNGTRRTFI